MQKILSIAILIFLVISCQTAEEETNRSGSTGWEGKRVEHLSFDGLEQGETYLPVYSSIFHIQEDRIFNLTITVSMRNISSTDTAYILKADYYNTGGDNIRQYLDSPIYLKPMETLEIVIAEEDVEGGSGANFLFDWAVQEGGNAPLFEAVMISTYRSQGLSFSTRGLEVH